MGDYAFRMMSAVLSSEFCPASVRTVAMRAVGFQISRQACIWARGCFRSKRLRVGRGVFINVGFYHDGYDMLEIGTNVRIGPYVRVITATHDIGPAHQRGLVEVTAAPVRIEDGCWIAAGVTILPGVTVRRGCVIGANSLVMRSTEPNGLYLGTPARRVRELDP